MSLPLDYLQKYHICAALGLLIGLILFVNRPSLLEMIIGTSLTAIYGASTGYAIYNPGFRKKWIVATFSILIAAGFFVLTPSGNGCLAYDIFNPPSTNPLTGETTHGDYDGFRLKHCDKGRHPWYYQKLEGDELKSYCENHPNNTHCQLAEEQNHSR